MDCVSAVCPQPDDHKASWSCGELLAATLKSLGITTVFGLVGIPITEIATSLHTEGIYFVAHRSENAAVLAASCYGFIHGGTKIAAGTAKGHYWRVPGVALTTGGPGFVNALTGLAHASCCNWPTLLISGSSTSQLEPGCGAFQELDQYGIITAVKPRFGVYATKCNRLDSLPLIVAEAARQAVTKFSAAYVDLSADVAAERVPASVARKVVAEAVTRSLVLERQCLGPALEPGTCNPASPVRSAVATIAARLATSSAPLLVLGDSLAMCRVDALLARVVNALGIATLPLPMARGLIDDEHSLCVAAARSRVIQEADYCVLLAARLDWMLHFGTPPRWNSNIEFTHIVLQGEPLEDPSAAAAIRFRTPQSTVMPCLAARVQRFELADIEDLEDLMQLLTGLPVGSLTEAARDWTDSVVTEAAGRRDALQQRLLEEAKCESRCSMPYDTIADATLTLENDREVDLDPVLVGRSELQEQLEKIATCVAKPPNRPTVLLTYRDALGAIRRELERERWVYGASGTTPFRRFITIAEGSSTLDLSRRFLSVSSPRSRLDCGSWAAMGVGLPFAIAALAPAPLARKRHDSTVALMEESNLIALCLEGDSAIGFSLAELETIARYKLSVIICVFNNGGIGTGEAPYETTSSNFQGKHRPWPNQLNVETRYDRVAAALGGWGCTVSSVSTLQVAIRAAVEGKGLGWPRLINILLDPKARE